MRIDRLVTLGLVAPWRRLARPSEDEARTPILMYHAISDQVDRGVSAYYRTVTSRAAFERQMRYLFDTGFSAVTLSEALASWKMPSRASDAGSAPRREVVVTFDDGFGDIYTDALPILRRFGFRATVFLSTDYIGRNFVTGRQCLDEDQIRRLMHGGIEFGSHTASHPQLHNLDFEQIRAELIRSKERIEQIIGNAVTLFSYPYRFPEEDEEFVEALGDLLAKIGYTAGVTTSIGRASLDDAPLFLKRLPVNDCDDERLFAAKLSGAYDWLHTGQIAYKRVRALRRPRPVGARP